MRIKRDLSDYLVNMPSLPAQVLLGPRQCGKSFLLQTISPDWKSVTLDDLRSRQMAQQDPALFMTQYSPPVVIDEIQYASQLFPQIKLLIDQMRQNNPRPDWPQVRMTGSHQILMSSKIKESLGGRANFFRLHTLSLAELKKHFSTFSIEQFIFRGGWPELVVSPNLSSVDYLNDYIQTVVDKDVALESGVKDLDKFHKALGLLAARVGEIINFEGLGNEIGVSGVTLKSWLGALNHSGLAGLLKPFHSNLNKRLIKSPKFYFTDTGLACRLQGHLDSSIMFKSVQMGHLFENLVFTEILKCRDHHRKNWNLYFWRTKEKEEYDFIIDSGKSCIVMDAQLSIQSARAIRPSEKLRRDLHGKNISTAVCTYGGTQALLSNDCLQVPVEDLAKFLLKTLE